MTNFDRLAQADFQNQWLCLNDKGQLDVVKKDNRFVRAFKTIIGTICRHDFYENIHLGKLAGKIADLAKNENDTKNLACYIETVDKVTQQFYTNLRNKSWSQEQQITLRELTNVQGTLKKDHPEMFFAYDGGCYRNAHVQYRYPHNPSENDKALAQSCKVVPNAGELYLYHRHRDASGNRWLDCRLHLTVRTKIDARTAKPTSLGYEITIPEWSYKELHYKALTCLLGDGKEPLQTNAERFIEIDLFDLEADIQEDGSCQLPNGQKFQVSSLLQAKDKIFLSELVPVTINLSS